MSPDAAPPKRVPSSCRADSGRPARSYPAESSQTCEQYFLPSVQTQLQAVCAHFLASAMCSSRLLHRLLT